MARAKIFDAKMHFLRLRPHYKQGNLYLFSLLQLKLNEPEHEYAKLQQNKGLRPFLFDQVCDLRLVASSAHELKNLYIFVVSDDRFFFLSGFPDP